MNTIVSEEIGAKRLSGGRIIAECLAVHGVDTAFCVPGESFLAVLDALHDYQDQIRVIVGRHEAGTANMAEAYGKLTGKPGVCFVTRGPGSAQAAVALHTAWQDSTPMIMFVGQVAREQRGREAFQEVDYRDAYGHTAKWVVEISDPARAVEIVSRAFHVAVNGRPGPVVISLPEDMQDEVVSFTPPAPFRRAIAAPSASALGDMQHMIERAARPLVVLGGGGWSARAVADIRQFAEAFALPVVCGFRRQDLFDNTHANYAGFIGFGTNPRLWQMFDESDLLLVLGERLGDTTTTGYTLVDFPRPRQKLIHVHPDPEELGILYEGDVLINATMADTAQALAALNPARQPDRTAWIRRGHDEFLAFAAPRPDNPQDVDVPAIISRLAIDLPPNAVVTNGAGTYTGYVHRHYLYRSYGSQLAPTSGAMGYGLPAAIAAKLVDPSRPVVCFAGDGCFLMASPEFATAFQHDLPITVVVIDNAGYGSIRVHQEKRYPGRVFSTHLRNPDFVAFAKAFGGYAEEVTRTEDFTGAFERAQASGKPSLLHIRIDMEKILSFNPRTA